MFRAYKVLPDHGKPTGQKKVTAEITNNLPTQERKTESFKLYPTQNKPNHSLPIAKSWGTYRTKAETDSTPLTLHTHTIEGK